MLPSKKVKYSRLRESLSTSVDSMDVQCTISLALSGQYACPSMISRHVAHHVRVVKRPALQTAEAATSPLGWHDTLTSYLSGKFAIGRDYEVNTATHTHGSSLLSVLTRCVVDKYRTAAWMCQRPQTGLSSFLFHLAHLTLCARTRLSSSWDSPRLLARQRQPPRPPVPNGPHSRNATRPAPARAQQKPAPHHRPRPCRALNLRHLTSGCPGMRLGI